MKKQFGLASERFVSSRILLAPGTLDATGAQ